MIARHPKLRKDPAPGTWSVRAVLRFALGGAVYALGVGIAFLSAPVVFALSALVAGYYVLDQVTSAAPEYT